MGLISEVAGLKYIWGLPNHFYCRVTIIPIAKKSLILTQVGKQVSFNIWLTCSLTYLNLTNVDCCNSVPEWLCSILIQLRLPHLPRWIECLGRHPQWPTMNWTNKRAEQAGHEILYHPPARDIWLWRVFGLLHGCVDDLLAIPSGRHLYIVSICILFQRDYNYPCLWTPCDELGGMKFRGPVPGTLPRVQECTGHLNLFYSKRTANVAVSNLTSNDQKLHAKMLRQPLSETGGIPRAPPNMFSLKDS